MTEANPIESVNDFSRKISDGVALLPFCGEKLLGPECELALGFSRCSLEFDSGQYLGESAVEQRSRREGCAVRDGTAQPAQQRLDQPVADFLQRRLTERRPRTRQ